METYSWGGLKGHIDFLMSIFFTHTLGVGGGGGGGGGALNLNLVRLSVRLFRAEPPRHHTAGRPSLCSLILRWYANSVVICPDVIIFLCVAFAENDGIDSNIYWWRHSENTPNGVNRRTLALF